MISEPARGESTQIYSASEAAQRLGVSVGMLRRYALAFEALGGEITLDPQRGRRYTGKQVELLEKSRAFVQANPGLGVEDGVRAALGGDVRLSVKPPPPMPGELAVREAVASAMRPVLAEALEPMLEQLKRQEEEIRALREQLQGLPLPEKHRGWWPWGRR